MLDILAIIVGIVILMLIGRYIWRLRPDTNLFEEVADLEQERDKLRLSIWGEDD